MDHTAATLSGLAATVRDALAASGLGVNQAADASGVARTTFKRHLVDGAWTSRELVQVATVLGTTPSALYAAAEKAVA